MDACHCKHSTDVAPLYLEMLAYQQCTQLCISTIVAMQLETDHPVKMRERIHFVNRIYPLSIAHGRQRYTPRHVSADTQAMLDQSSLILLPLEIPLSLLLCILRHSFPLPDIRCLAVSICLIELDAAVSAATFAPTLTHYRAYYM